MQADVVVLDNILFECEFGQKSLSIRLHYTLVPQYLDNDLNNVSTTIKNTLDAKFDIIIDVIENGFQALQNYTEVDGSTYTLEFSNGGEDSTDQGVNTNVDILPGKLVTGKTSGARGRIVKYTSGLDLGGQSFDRCEVVLVEPREFRIGEELEYGNPNKRKTNYSNC